MYFSFCRVPLCTAEAKYEGNYCGRHRNRYFPPGEECAWCGADLVEEPARCWNDRGEAFCRPSHRAASNRALRRLRKRCE